MIRNPQVVQPPPVIAPGAPPTVVQPLPETPPGALPPSAGGKTAVGLLLPLSGPSAALGQAMLDAAEMALYDLAGEQLELLTRDTKGTPDGASAAAQQLLSQGAQIILGPLLAPEVGAVKIAAPVDEDFYVRVIAINQVVAPLV